MQVIHIDFETRSTVDLKVAGSWKYARHHDTSVLCMGWAIDDGPVGIWFEGDLFPAELRTAIEGGAYLAAWNAQFERHIWSLCQVPNLGWPEIEFDKWRCVAAKAAHAAHNRRLATAAVVLIPDQLGKDKYGTTLIRAMCKPRKRTKKDGPGTDLLWVEDVLSLALLGAYCKQDVVVERAINKVLPPWPADEVQVWLMNERINDRGVPFDVDLCEAGAWVLNEQLNVLGDKIAVMTDGVITTGNQVQRIKQYVHERGINLESLDKQHIEEALKDDDLPEDVRDILMLRQAVSGAAAKKYQSAVDVMDDDGRGRGLFMYYGGTTGRFASLKTQIQNMKKGADATGKFRETVCSRDMARIKETYNGETITVLGKNIRTIVRAEDGNLLVRCDSSQIECRVLHWLAGNEPMLQTFRNKEDPYIKLATRVFNKQIRKGDPERQIGKFAVLGLGFGMGAKRFVAQVWEQAGIELTPRFAQRVVDIYRKENPLVPRYWDNLEMAAERCVTQHAPMRVGKVQFKMDGDYLTVTLPSGRRLFFYQPSFEGDRRDLRFSYHGPRGRRSEWAGGLLTENLVQATARDTLVHYAKLAEMKGLTIVAHIHDELMLEAPEEDAETVEQLLLDCFDTPAPWMAGLPCAAEAKIDRRYR